MPKSIQSIVDEINPTLPEGLWAWFEPSQDAVVVGNHHLAFIVTRKTIDDGLYMQTVRGTVPHLLKAIQWPQRAYEDCAHDRQKTAVISDTSSADPVQHPWGGAL